MAGKDCRHADLRKLAAAGLAPQRENSTLAAFLDAYIDGRSDVKDRTRNRLTNSRNKLVRFFGENKPLRSITPGDADDFRDHLVKAGQAEATVSKAIKHARQFFRRAVRKGIIHRSPFEDVRTGSESNRDRDYFVTQGETEKVIDACPDGQWRLIIALARYGGLRCPSEHLALTWADVDWQAGRIVVRATKTERHDNGGQRIVPIFPELRPHLEAEFENAPEGTQHVITRYRDSNANLRTQMLRIIGRAGLNPWPKLFQNMRASRETELQETFPSHVVCAWIGNSAAVAAKHYLQVTDDHFDRALHFCARNVRAGDRNTSQAYTNGDEKTLDFPGFSTDCDSLPNGQTPPRGVEPLFLD